MLNAESGLSGTKHPALNTQDTNLLMEGLIWIFRRVAGRKGRCTLKLLITANRDLPLN